MTDVRSPSRRVLVVDDSPAVCELLRMCLSDIAEVFVAYSGGEAVVTALEIQPRLAIIDIVLPGVNGFEVAEALRQHMRPTPPQIVFITGLREPANAYRARELGAIAVFHKPLPAESMRQVVVAALDTAVV